MTTTEQLLEALRKTKLPRDRRRNVRRDEADAKSGMCLGYVVKYDTGWAASRYTMSDPSLSTLLCQYARERFPDFSFSAIMVNRGSSALHVDAGNTGQSLIVSMGEHSGGELWQYPGQKLSIKDSLQACEGRLPHITLPFEGERYSVVYFNTKYGNRREPVPEQQSVLDACGFSPPPNERVDDMKPRTDLLQHAAELLARDWGLSEDYVGDFRNESIKARKRRPARIISS